MKQLTKLEYFMAISIIERHFKEADWLDKVSEVLSEILQFDCFDYSVKQMDELYNLLGIPEDNYYERRIEDANGYCRQWTDDELESMNFYHRDWIEYLEEYVTLKFPDNLKRRSVAFLSYLLDHENTIKISFTELIKKQGLKP